MSGTPSWAIIGAVDEFDHGVDDALGVHGNGYPVRAPFIPNSHLASITSRPLFIMDAESIVIFFPIDQFGCSKRIRHGNPRKLLRGQLKKGPS